MIDAKAIELAVVAMLQTEELPAAKLRAKRSLAETQPGDKKHERGFPCVDIRADPPETAADGVHRIGTVYIRSVSLTDADRDHADVFSLEDAVQQRVDNLNYQVRTSTTGTERTAFLASLAENAPLVTLHGVQVGRGSGPIDTDGACEVTINLIVHYTKTGF